MTSTATNAQTQAAAIIHRHAPHPDGGCYCGGLKPGTPHADHVAQVLADLGLLAGGQPVQPKPPADISWLRFERIGGHG